MLSRLIVNSYRMFIEIALWLSLVVTIIAGWQIPSSTGASAGQAFFSLIGAVIMWFIVAVIFFGAFLVIDDIRDRVKNIESR